MPQSLIIFDTEVDNLWRRHLPAPPDAAGDDSADSERIIIDLKSPSLSLGLPYYHNPVNWRRWFRQRHIEQLHCYLPGRKALLLLAAAPKSTEIILHLTAPVTPDALRCLKIFKKSVRQFSCAGNFIAAQLAKANINPEQITVEVPSLSPRPLDPARRGLIRRRIKKEKTGPLILALPRPQNAAALKPVVWAAAMLGHTLRDFTLVVTGPCDQTEQQRLQRWQKTMDAAGVVYLDQGNFAFDDLVNACDAVAAGAGPCREVIRLLYARAQKQHIVACNGAGAEYLKNYHQAFYASSTTPRQIAGAILELLEQKRGQEPFFY